MEITPQHWGIIINPKAGKKKYRSQRIYLFQQLKHAEIQFDYRITKFAGHASKIARYFVENNYKNILVLGGDGTISEVINGIFSATSDNKHNITIALIPRGTGNDWARFWSISMNYKTSIQTFLKGNTKSIDIGKVDYHMEGVIESHFFINSLGFGLDAKVVSLTHRLKEILGSHSFMYVVSLLLAVFTYRSQGVRIFAQEKELKEQMFTMNIANGCYSGGGLKQTPEAVPYDGLLDVMMAKKPRFFDIISGLVYLFRGKLLEHKLIESFKTTSITVQTNKCASLEADGIIVNGLSPFTISVLPNAIKMIVP